MMPRLTSLLAAILFLAGALVLPAQERREIPESPVVTLDQQRLFEESDYGRAVLRRLEARGEALARENRRIEAELAAEERALTEARRDMAAETFREKARAFDQKVSRIRDEQDAAGRALVRRREDVQTQFFQKALPILAELLREIDARVVIESRAVVLSDQRVDITDAAIARINENLPPPDTPDPVPDE